MINRDAVSPGNGKVIQLERFLNGVSLSPIRQIEAYWTALREDGSIPMRSQIDPRGMSSALEYTFILERIAPGMARFRIAGQHLCGLAGMEVRGMPLTAFFTPVARPEIGATLENIFDTPAVAELDLKGEVARTGAPSTSARMLMLPLRSDFGRVDRILGVLMSTEQKRPMRTPIRFEIASAQIRGVDGAPDPFAVDSANLSPNPAPSQTGFAEPAPGFTAAPLSQTKTDTDQPAAKPRVSAGPAWQDAAARPMDQVGAPGPKTPEHAAQEETPRRKTRDVPYLRLVKTDG